ncbi:tetratricopeptide repeat protein, partial [Propylenella binzhouense]|uniref:tetratricopeptide repeat protein n=1 Tax=Propylenella binzhouense TaxID=2555902 RepID=UPI003CCCAE2B
LAAEAAQAPPAAGGRAERRRAAALLALLGIPVLAAGLYLAKGAPDLPGQPLEARLEQGGKTDIETLVARVEERLRQSPEDGRGWAVLAPVYVRLGRPQDAVEAYRNVIRLLGTSAERQADLGEAIYLAEGGIVTAAAREAFEAANAADPKAAKPRFFLALAQEQAGEKAKAVEAWRALLADAAPDAPWRATVEGAIARAGGAPPPAG